MKGYVEVERLDLLTASVGFHVRYHTAEETLKKGIDLYYEKHYTNGSRFTKWRHRNKTPKEFARVMLPPFGTWDELLCDVLTKEENDEVHWWSYTTKNSDRDITELYNAGGERILINVDMARFVNKYKHYLENCK